MLRQLRSAISILLLLTVLTGGVYPLVVYTVSRVAFPEQARGSRIVRDGKVVGSRLIGQAFGAPGLFWSRPSATSPGPYAPGTSSGSNLGPTNPALRTAVADRIAALQAADPGNIAPIPIDLVTSSGSGLDPHVSPAAALWQVGRVARARNLPEERVHALVMQHVEGRTFGILGEPRVNVLELNLALADLH